MTYNTEIFRQQIGILDRFAYHLSHYRELAKSRIFELTNLQFWFDTYEAHLLQAAICWCMVFGSDGSSEIHWKKLATENLEDFLNSFREGLFKHTGKSRSDWDQYWEEMKFFRDNYAAHRAAQDFSKPVPNFDFALEIAYYFEDWVREIIAPDILTGPSLREVVQQVQTSTAKELLRIMPNPSFNPDAASTGEQLRHSS